LALGGQDWIDLRQSQEIVDLVEIKGTAPSGLTQSWGETGFLDTTLRFIANSCGETRFLCVSPSLLKNVSPTPSLLIALCIRPKKWQFLWRFFSISFHATIFLEFA
jgi:hypothetical protein